MSAGRDFSLYFVEEDGATAWLRDAALGAEVPYLNDETRFNWTVHLTERFEERRTLTVEDADRWRALLRIATGKPWRAHHDPTCPGATNCGLR